jgi:hypothetical protein
VGNCRAAGKFTGGTFHVDVYPLFVASCLGKLVDALLCHFDPVADSNLSPDGRLNFFEVFEDTHLKSDPSCESPMLGRHRRKCLPIQNQTRAWR